ncbi:MAG: hypothetical protein AABZ47_01780 [Planctomycetota bacterium]
MYVSKNGTRWRFFLIATGLSAFGCQSNRFSQTHYVGVVNKDTESVQFYRFKLKGFPGWTKTKFVTGWYSADAIDTFLGEQKFDTPKTSDSKSAGEDAENYLVTGPEGQGFPIKDKRFTIIMSADPSPITDAISKIAKDEGLKKLIDDKVKKAEQKAEEKAKEKEAMKKQLDQAAIAALKLQCSNPAYQKLITLYETFQGIEICPKTAPVVPGGTN